MERMMQSERCRGCHSVLNISIVKSLKQLTLNRVSDEDPPPPSLGPLLIRKPGP